MAGSNGHRVERSGEIPAPVSAVWDRIADWAGWLQWYPLDQVGKPGSMVPGVEKHEVIDSLKDIPCRRLVTLPDSSVITETLLESNPQHHHIRYSIDGMPGIISYVADVRIEPRAERCCMLYWSCEFEVAEGVSADDIKEYIGGIYDQAFIEGLRRFFSKN